MAVCRARQVGDNENRAGEKEVDDIPVIFVNDQTVSSSRRD